MAKKRKAKIAGIMDPAKKVLMRYGRISREKDDSRGAFAPIETQRAVTERVIAEHGIKDGGWFTDVDVSGTVPRKERTAYARMLDAARLWASQGMRPVICVTQVDRLGRSLHDLTAFLKEEYDELGYDFVCVTQPFDLSTHMGRTMFAMAGVFAEDYSNAISHKTRLTLKMRKESGTCLGGAPWWMRAVGANAGRRFVPDEKQRARYLAVKELALQKFPRLVTSEIFSKLMFKGVGGPNGQRVFPLRTLAKTVDTIREEAGWVHVPKRGYFPPESVAAELNPSRHP